MAVIMAAIAGAFGLVATLLYRLNSAADATRGLADAAHDLANFKRRWSWRRRSSADQLRMVDDPRVGAVAMMVAVAQADGAMTTAERSAILDECRRHFDCSAKTAGELLGYGRFLIGHSTDAEGAFRKLLPLFAKSCGPTERADLVVMMQAVAGSDGAVPDALTRSIDTMARSLK